MTSPEKITFHFGENWKSFLRMISEEEIRSAIDDIEKWLGKDNVSDKTVIDIGSGSGIHSLAFHMLGARLIRSFDIDPGCVEATGMMYEKMNKPSEWIISQGSILDDEFIINLDLFDIVYAWGVLHHTGSMWKAIENASCLVKPGGSFWFSIYAKGPNYERDLALKKKYNNSSSFGKRLLEATWILRIMGERLLNLNNPLRWNEKKERGMTVYHDIVDWLGGLPYEVASTEEVIQYLSIKGFILKKLHAVSEGACNIYLFSKS